MPTKTAPTKAKAPAKASPKPKAVDKSAVKSAPAKATKPAAKKPSPSKEPKTKPNTASVQDFLASVADEKRRADAMVVEKLMREATGEKPVMWGGAIVGYGSYRAASGDWPLIGFSPRKANLVLYLMDGYAGREAQLAKLGKHKIGKSCLYLNRLSDVDQAVLKEMMAASFKAMKARHA